MSLERRKKDSRKYSVGNIGKWLAIGSELPIMVITGVFIGNYIGQQFGPPLSSFWPILGAVLGLLVGTYSIFKIIRLWESQEISERINKKSAPTRPPPPPIESDVGRDSSPKAKKDSGLTEDEKWERILSLMKLQVNFDEDEASSRKNNSEFEE